jgi:hypothetical protein
VDELSRKWMITVVNSEADEKNSMLEWPDGATRVARNTHWTSRADEHPDGCPTEGGRAPFRGRQVPDGERYGCPTEGAMGARRRARWVPNGGWVSGVARRGSI